MIPVLYLLLFLLLWAAIAYVLTTRGMKGPWSTQGPARVAGHVQGRNRAVLIATVAVIVLAAVLEALLPDVSDAILGLQYAFGDALGFDPVGVFQTSNGTVSWALYLAVLAGTFVGLAVGTLRAVRRFPVLNGLSLRDLL